jgi:hypothetical protein
MEDARPRPSRRGTSPGGATDNSPGRKSWVSVRKEIQATQEYRHHPSAHRLGKCLLVTPIPLNQGHLWKTGPQTRICAVIALGYNM